MIAGRSTTLVSFQHLNTPSLMSLVLGTYAVLVAGYSVGVASVCTGNRKHCQWYSLPSTCAYTFTNL